MFKKTISYIHVVLGHNQPTPTDYTCSYKAICVIIQFQVVRTNQYITSNFMCSSLHLLIWVRRPQLPLVILQDYYFHIFPKFVSN